jgi:hypothetical protein
MVRDKETRPAIINADEVETAPLRESHDIPVQQYDWDPRCFHGGNDGSIDPILVFCQLQRREKHPGHHLSDIAIADIFYQSRIRISALAAKIAPQKVMVMYLGKASQLAANRLKDLGAS